MDNKQEALLSEEKVIEAKTVKKRATKKVKPVVSEEVKAPEQFSVDSVKKTPIEQSVLIMSCLNPIVSDAAIQAAKNNGVEVVILEDRVIHDYLSNRGYEEGQEKRDIGEFLNSTSNRIHAEDQCVKLWSILTGGKPIEDSDNVIFSKTDVVKRTSLTHSTASSVFQLLRAFGMLEFVKGTHEFKLHFDSKRRHSTIQTEILSMCKAINSDILRYKASIDSDKNLNQKQKNNFCALLESTIKKTIEF